MRWDAISFVSSGLTLAAFLAALFAWISRGKLDERERLIRTAKEESRGPLVDKALEFFSIETAFLTREQRYSIAIEQIRNRHKRFTQAILLAGLLSLLLVSVAVWAILQSSSTPIVEPHKLSIRDFPCRRAWIFLGAYDRDLQRWTQVYFSNYDSARFQVSPPLPGDRIIVKGYFRHLVVQNYKKQGRHKCGDLDNIPIGYNYENAEEEFETGFTAPKGSLLEVVQVEKLPPNIDQSPVKEAKTIYYWAKVGPTE